MTGLAILGAGIFARDNYLPAIRACSHLFTLKAVYSRSQTSSDGFAVEAASPIDTYFDSPQTPDRSLDHLLARKDIGAVIVCLPIPVQPDVIRKAISAGKAVLSEKPIAKDIATAESLLGWHAGLSQPPVWAVAENFRVAESLDLAARKLAEVGGELLNFRLKVTTWMTENNKYFHTEWRKTPQYQGGYLLDGGIHGIAGLRKLIEPTGHVVQKVACFSALVDKRLPPVDTVFATALTDKGRHGTVSLSWATEHGSGWEVEVSTTGGLVIWNDTSVRVIKGTTVVESVDMEMDSSIAAELQVFASSIAAGGVDSRLSPAEGLKDVKLIQALFESGDAGGAVKTVGN